MSFYSPLFSVDVEHACHGIGLVGDDAHRTAFQTAKANDDIGCVTSLNLEKIGIIDDAGDDGRHSDKRGGARQRYARPAGGA